MELQRVLAKDSRAAMDQVHKLYVQDALVISLLFSIGLDLYCGAVGRVGRKQR